ncbi:hypothetical protein Ancab_006622 [Ancistrocladus abbreviatus]
MVGETISETKSPINEEQRQLVEEHNADARPIMATDREVGALRNMAAENVVGDKERAMRSYHNNDKIILFLEDTFGGGLKNDFSHMEIGLSERLAIEGELQGT